MTISRYIDNNNGGPRESPVGRGVLTKILEKIHMNMFLMHAITHKNTLFTKFCKLISWDGTLDPPMNYNGVTLKTDIQTLVRTMGKCEAIPITLTSQILKKKYCYKPEKIFKMGNTSTTCNKMLHVHSVRDYICGKCILPALLEQLMY